MTSVGSVTGAFLGLGKGTAVGGNRPGTKLFSVRSRHRIVRDKNSTKVIARAGDASTASRNEFQSHTRLYVSPFNSRVTRTTTTPPTATGSEGDLVETFGRYAGAALGVVGLSFVAGTMADAPEDEDVPQMGDINKPQQKGTSQKQTIAGGVAGANNAGKKKPMPGGVLPSKNSGKESKDNGMLGMLTKAAGKGPAKTFSFTTPKYDWGVAEAEGPREYMEDAWTVKESGFANGFFFASVMDGHGGSASSAYLRNSLSDSLSQYVGQVSSKPSVPGEVPDGTPDGGYLQSALDKGFTATDEKLINHVAALGEPECWSGSTCTSVLINQERIVCANVGDSRALLVRAQGKNTVNSKGYELSADHRPVGSNKVGRQELDRIVRAGAWSVGGRVCGILAVSRAFGDYEFKGGRFDLLEDLSEEPLAKKATMNTPPVVANPNVFECARDVEKDEWLVIASDGLWDTVNSQQCVSFIKQETKKNTEIDGKTLADLLVKRALRFRTQDNVAVVCVDLRDKTSTD